MYLQCVSVMPYLACSHYDPVLVLGGGEVGWCTGWCPAIELHEVLRHPFPLQRDGYRANVLINTQEVLVL